jgi:hypothetical protein
MMAVITPRVNLLCDAFKPWMQYEPGVSISYTQYHKDTLERIPASNLYVSDHEIINAEEDKLKNRVQKEYIDAICEKLWMALSSFNDEEKSIISAFILGIYHQNAIYAFLHILKGHYTMKMYERYDKLLSYIFEIDKISIMVNNTSENSFIFDCNLDIKLYKHDLNSHIPNNDSNSHMANNDFSIMYSFKLSREHGPQEIIISKIKFTYPEKTIIFEADMIAVLTATATPIIENKNYLTDMKALYRVAKKIRTKALTAEYLARNANEE